MIYQLIIISYIFNRAASPSYSLFITQMTLVNLCILRLLVNIYYEYMLEIYPCFFPAQVLYLNLYHILMKTVKNTLNTDKKCYQNSSIIYLLLTLYQTNCFVPRQKYVHEYLGINILNILLQ